MEIDLLTTPHGELGLISNTAFRSEVSCIIFDVAERSLTLESGESMDSLKLNVPVGEDFTPLLRNAELIHICAIEKGRMAYAKQVPLVKVSLDEDDTFSSGNGHIGHGIMGVQSWLRQSTSAQPVHRDDLTNTTSNGGVIHREGLSPATMHVAPQLAKALTQEQQLVQRAQLQNVPRMAPPSLGPGTQSPMLGLGNLRPRPPTDTSDEDK
jgi:hypothetical protein